MKTLNRPMFNMGGPIKQGIMHGIREPKKHGGKMLLVGQHPKEFQDKSGREKHIAPLIGIGARVLPWALRGLKAGWKYMKPTSIPRNIYTKQASNLPIGMRGTIGSRTTMTPRTNWQMSKEWMKANPGYTLTGGLAAYNAPSTYEGIKSTAGPLKKIALQAADLAVPDWIWDQDQYLADKEAKGIVSDIEKPGGFKKIKKAIEKAKELSASEKEAFAIKQRTERVNKYLDLMGYDRSKKMAIADALIDASKIVGDRGTLKPENIGRDLINPIIQATSKRLDKPQQIREAVGLMATKAEIEKDLNEETDALAKKLTLTKIKQGERSLEEGFEIDIRNLLLTSRTAPSKKTLERYARLSANKYGLDFTKVADDTVRNAAGETEEEKIQSVVGDDGIYMIGDAIIKVTGGVPIQVA